MFFHLRESYLNLLGLYYTNSESEGDANQPRCHPGMRYDIFISKLVGHTKTKIHEKSTKHHIPTSIGIVGLGD